MDNRQYQREWARKYFGWSPLNRQRAGKKHTFPCGCSGVLPKSKGQVNKFANWIGRSWVCRVGYILTSCRISARTGGYASIVDSHSAIRDLMKATKCERCREPLIWKFGSGKTPHLHHDHRTGKAHGFTHNRCNPNALEIEIERLKRQIRRLHAAQETTAKP